jgi:hypothetical protein
MVEDNKPPPPQETVPPPPTTLEPKREGGHTRLRVRRWGGGSQFGRLENKPSNLSTLCYKPSTINMHVLTTSAVNVSNGDFWNYSTSMISPPILAVRSLLVENKMILPCVLQEVFQVLRSRLFRGGDCSVFGSARHLPAPGGYGKQQDRVRRLPTFRQTWQKERVAVMHCKLDRVNVESQKPIAKI